MEYRAWKKQNGAGESIRTSLLGYGCMRFPTTPEGAIDEPRAEALLNAARDAGVNYFDTAYPYHGGQSEPFVGRVIAKWPRESFYLATKMPLWQCGSLEEAQHIFEEQLRRLGVEYIDFYLLHSLHTARYDQAKAIVLAQRLRMHVGELAGRTDREDGQLDVETDFGGTVQVGPAGHDRHGAHFIQPLDLPCGARLGGLGSPR